MFISLLKFYVWSFIPHSENENLWNLDYEDTYDAELSVSWTGTNINLNHFNLRASMI